MSLNEALAEGERLGEGFSLVIPNNRQVGKHGDRRGFKAGHSIDFRDFRDYQPGDDIRQLDWGVYARSDRLTIRQYEEEIMPHIDILVDASKSMLIGEKYPIAWCLASLLAVAAKRSKFRTKVIPVRDQCIPLLSSMDPPSTWDVPAADEDKDWTPFASRLIGNLTRNSMRVMISDFLWPEEPNKMIEPIMSGASSFVFLQVLGSEDLHPMRGGSLQLVDSETEESLELVIDQTHLREYSENLRRHLDEWQKCSRGLSSPLVVFEAEKWKERGVHALLSEQIISAD